jgi:hypothetical protein
MKGEEIVWRADSILKENRVFPIDFLGYSDVECVPHVMIGCTHRDAIFAQLVSYTNLCIMKE